MLDNLKEEFPEVEDDVVTDWLGNEAEALISMAEALVSIYSED